MRILAAFASKPWKHNAVILFSSQHLPLFAWASREIFLRLPIVISSGRSNLWFLEPPTSTWIDRVASLEYSSFSVTLPLFFQFLSEWLFNSLLFAFYPPLLVSVRMLVRYACNNKLKTCLFFLVLRLLKLTLKFGISLPAIGVIVARFDIWSHSTSLKTRLSHFKRGLLVIDGLLEKFDVFLHVEDFLHDLQVKEENKLRICQGEFSRSNHILEKKLNDELRIL